ncbi:shwachman-Bodian-diamond syndrome protein-like protein [Bimuria novae-zelandiae CBS 107.79]|uniref:Shwachman-Bodian-diamond syndrome protein-like protein n=1 Tax=Bimuria novae-zelandiae CBS 107.79 TaxID=1447943 RepID=A0A6A5VIM4_9PLEO|nr:shwachman-Bodian-diamond syndrome protein-like protein [Bimuria novae-zelandiae CBS 107.79]
MPINQPSNQIKLTNVTLVRMRKGKKRFEIACYKNKIQDWKNKIEKDLDNVIQIEGVYLNVSKGQRASKADLEKAWPGKTNKEIVEDILEHGEYQVGEKERGAELERIKHEVINIVASKLVEPKSKRVYTTGLIEKSLDQLSQQYSGQQQGEKDAAEDKEKALPKWRGVVATKDAKSQANHAIKCLMAHQPIPVTRIQMRLRIICPTAITKQTVKSAAKEEKGKGAVGEEQQAPKSVKETLLSYVEIVETEETTGSEWEAVGLVEPGNYKHLNDFIESQTKGRGRVEVLDQSVGVDV